MKNKEDTTGKTGTKPTKNSLNDYARYSTLAFEMIAIILAGVFGGIYLDKLMNWGFPVFTLFLTIIFVVLAIYVAIKDEIHPK
jgi:ATP synthase protein I